MDQECKDILPKDLLVEVNLKKKEGNRFIAITCTSYDNLEITYSFAKGLDPSHLRICVPCKDEIDSICSVYPYAFLYENEVNELFGANIKGIPVDFQGNLYLISEKKPFSSDKAKENS